MVISIVLHRSMVISHSFFKNTQRFSHGSPKKNRAVSRHVFLAEVAQDGALRVEAAHRATGTTLGIPKKTGWFMVS